MDLMIDLETFGKGPGALFTQIGWAFFESRNRGSAIKSGTIYVDSLSAEKFGLKLDASTVLWWLRQDRNAQLEMLKSGQDLDSALVELASLIREHNPKAIWANSPSFDLVILDSAYRACGREVPWSFWDEMDVRTLVKATGVTKHKPTIAHVASADAVAQALTVQDAFVSMLPAGPG